jgi:hypothetical protein
VLKVRERGEFWLRVIHLQYYTIAELKQKILEKYNDPKKGEIIWIYELWDRERLPFSGDTNVQSLSQGTELEVVFENPSSPYRGSYSDWYWKKIKEKNN